MFLGGIGVKILPLFAVDQQFVYFGRIDQLHVVHVERITVVYTVVCPEGGIVAGGEDHIAHGRFGITHIENRHFDPGPLLVFGTCAVPSFGYLLCRLFHAELIAVGCAPDIRLLVDALGRGGCTFLVLVLAALGCALP